MSGSICGVLFVNKRGQTVPCYVRGRDYYGGRCSAHRDDDLNAPQRLLCGWKRSPQALGCANPVRQAGQHCLAHAPARTEAMDERRRNELEERLAWKLERCRAMERDIGELRAELARLGGGVDREAAE
jgi:hypothetical protein